MQKKYSIQIFVIFIFTFFVFLPKNSYANEPKVWFTPEENWEFRSKLTISDGSALLGRSISISGDYAIVGALDAAYIFRREGIDWIEEERLLPSDGAGCGWMLGCPVSISGDYAVVGASDSAYVFKREGERWIEQIKLTIDDKWADFGKSVLISGSYVFIGAPEDILFHGAIYIFKRNGTSWEEKDKLIPYSNDEMYFGQSIAISGNYLVYNLRRRGIAFHL